jgi:carboxyl-terminal processing protease
LEDFMGKRSIVWLSVLWIVVVVAGVSSAITLRISGGVLPSVDQDDGSVVVSQEEYDMIERYRRLDEVRSILETDYYKVLDEDTLVLGAVRGMLESVEDPYTFYYTPEEMQEMAERSQGVYEGVGLLLSADKDGMLVVLRIFEDSPAIEAGVKPGDVVLAVNGETVSASDARAMDEAIQMIRDFSGDALELTLRRGKKVHTISLKPRTITMRRVTHQVLPGDIGYIMIYEFIGDDATGFISAVNDLKAQNVKGLIIDVRSNPGGLLSDVVKIADQLLPAGLIVYTQDRSGAREEYYSDENHWDVPMAVLVNGMSASASEILAGALQDYGVAKVVGVKTFGKGIVQTMLPFRSDGAGMQLTTATYFTPKGRSIHGVGIEPDVTVEATISVGGTPNLEKDAQLKAAYDLLTK